MTATVERAFTLIQGSDDGSRLTLGDDVAVYLQHKRKKLTAASRRGYIAALQTLEMDMLDAGLDAQIAAAEAVAEILGSRQARATVAHLRAAKELVRLTRDAASEKIVRFPDQRIGEHGAHSWWYRCLTRAGIVEPGTTSGTRMHSARHTSAQRVLERTGNLKDAQALLGHTSSATTDRYVGWDTANLEASMRKVLSD